MKFMIDVQFRGLDRDFSSNRMILVRVIDKNEGSCGILLFLIPFQPF